MKKQILIFLGITALLFVGCGGGGGTSVSYDDPKVIEDQDLFRVKSDEVGDFYIKERFDENNNTLYEGKYDMGHDLVPDSNGSTPYDIDLTYLGYVYIQYEPAIRCKVIDSNDSVEFWCLNEGASGSLRLYTTRWKTLDLAMDNPEE